MPRKSLHVYGNLKNFGQNIHTLHCTCGKALSAQLLGISVVAHKTSKLSYLVFPITQTPKEAELKVLFSYSFRKKINYKKTLYIFFCSLFSNTIQTTSGT